VVRSEHIATSADDFAKMARRPPRFGRIPAGFGSLGMTIGANAACTEPVDCIEIVDVTVYATVTETFTVTVFAGIAVGLRYNQ
jgi:hypothetical protein